ncbi:MAG: hypothetical protein CME62_02445 [Halobacteriovoraceae bacterium]|nr:hypothetical protein [Halobacteriovoraceae bacterium]|tara:strand:- start:3916 stop:4413 length:498 start_codon:yes stop_codon:yes gene_type:complete
MVKLLITLFIISQCALADSTCSRVATINYQEVLVDAGSGNRGEGLRFYLEKDPESKKLLDEYQRRNKPTLWSAGASTTGSFLILASFLSTSDSADATTKNTMLYGGGLLVALSYLTSKTLRYSNEKYLQQSIDQYNKRNSPRIYFSPYKDNNGSSGVGLGVSRGF